MNELIVILSIFFITAIGFLIIWSFDLLPEQPVFAIVPYGFGLGVGLTSLQLYSYSRIGIAWHQDFILIPWILLACILLLRKRKDIHFHVFSKPKLKPFWTILLILIFLTSGYVIFEALLRPVTSWDGWATWLMKSRVFFINGNIDLRLLQYLRSDDYPLVNNLLSTFMYLMMGQIDDTAVLLISSACYFFLSLLFYLTLRKKYSVGFSLLFTFLLMTTQNLIRHGGRLEAGLADLPLGYYFFASTTLFFEYLRNYNTRVLLLLNVFLGIACLIKYEAVPFSIVLELFIFFYIHKQRLYKQLFLILFWVIPILEWNIYKQMQAFQIAYFKVHGITLSFPKTINAFWGTFRELINVKSWNFLWIMYFYSFLLLKKNKEQIILTLLVISQFCVYIGLYIVTDYNSPQTSIERLLVHLAPLAMLAIVYAAFPDKYKKEYQNIFNRYKFGRKIRIFFRKYHLDLEK